MDISENQKNYVTLAGVIGLVAAILTGTGEFLLHFNPLGRYADGYEFMVGISAERTTIGHFFSVLGAPLYLVGTWHLMKMIEPANVKAAKTAFAVMVYGFVVGAVWIGSRASISAIVNDANILDPAILVSSYEIRYENLLQVTRLAALVLSVIFSWSVLTGRTPYPKWVAAFNPFSLILASFAIWLVIPSIGDYLMPMALNVAFFIIFTISIYFSKKTHG